MTQIIISIIIFLAVYYVTTWIVPQILSWFIRRKYHLETRVGKISFFKLHDVDIIKNGFRIHIDKIGFRSSFLSSEVTKLLCLVISEVRINKDVLYNSDHLNAHHQPNDEDILRHCETTFHNQKIPPIVITFAQFLAIHIRSITAMFLRPESPEWLLHATASDVQLDGSLVRSAKTLLVNIMMSSASARLLRHAPSTPVSTVSGCSKPRPASCLCEMSVALSLEVTLIAQGPLSVEKLYITTEQMKTVVNNGLYSFIQQRYQCTVSKNKDTRNDRKNATRASDVYTLMHHFSPVIPKVVEIKLKTSALTGMKDNIRTEIDASLDTFLIKTQFVPNELWSCNSESNILWPRMSLNLILERFEVKSNKDKIISLKEFTFESKLERRNMTISVVVHSLSTIYKHKDVHSWLITNFGYLSTFPKEMPSKKKEQINTGETAANWMNYLNLEISVEMFNIVNYFRLHPDFISGFESIKFLFSCDALPFEATTDNAISKSNSAATLDNYSSIFWKQNWTCEFLLDCLWSNLNYEHEIVNCPQFKKRHYWGFPIVTGIVFVKLRNGVAMKTLRIQSMIDMLRIEWSPPLANFLHEVYKCLADYYLIRKFDNCHKNDSVEKRNPIRILPDLVWSLNISNSNIFCIAERKVCIMARIDSACVSSDKLKLRLMLEGVKAVSIIPTKHYHVCTRSDDVRGSCLKMKIAQLEVNSNGTVTVELTEEIHFQWSPNLHLKLLTLFEDVKETLNNISGTHNSPENEQIAEVVKEKKFPQNIRIAVKGHFTFGLKYSSKRTILFSTEQWKFKKACEAIKLESPSFKISVDNQNIFSVEKFVLHTLPNDETIRLERKNADGFALPWNNTWEISIVSLKMVFPYEHEFSVAIHDEFLSVFKWLKLIHNKPKKDNSKVPRDFVIKIKELLFEMSDDPFEVSLRDSYELLVDEYEESIKRQKMLDEKLTQLCKDRPLLPAGKLEELYASLQEINARIYIQRSKQMKSQSPVRTRLFAWVISNLQIISLTDPSIVGAENVVRIMTDIDSESPWPEEGIEFTTLWCRWISVSCKEWKFLLRDFPQPWLDIGELQLWGKLVGAEQEATKRAKRSIEIELGEPYANVTIERSMTSLKFYHDLNCEAKHFSYAFGPCWEPVISQCNIAFSKIVSSSKDPSPLLPFWDKIRLIYHGRLTILIHQLTVLLHASLDPYNTTEEMEVTWNDVAMDWTNAKFIFKGDLEVYVRTASKYDDCRMLYLPNLKLAVKLTWICVGDPNDHHSVMPCAPNKLPEYSSNQEHDSFRAFRSQNLNLSLSLETKPLANLMRSTDCPVALLYGSTLRWFENLKLILSGVTRPTRRGAVFNNSRPHRQPLSRHYKKVHMSLALHRFQVHYWMSFSMQRGLELFGQRFSFSSEYMLTLVPIDDGLRHRPKAIWSTIYMNCDLNDAEVWLKSALHTGEEKEILNIHQPVEKCYFLSVGKVSYGREASMPGPIPGYGGSRQPNKDDTPTHRLVVYRLKGAWTASNRDIIFALYDSFRKTQQLKKNLSIAALKGFRCGDSSTPVKSRSRSIENPPASGAGAPVQTSEVVVQETLSPLTKLQSGQAASMLQQLIAEAENKAIVFSDDLSVQMREQHLHGLAVCQEDDVLHKNWLIALVNSQVLLKGCETKGYVIMSAAKAEILQRIHKPAWKERTLVSKTTWVGSLECMQYYATVSPNDNDSLNENIMWLSVENIQEKEASTTVIADLPDLPHLVGSGQSVGGVVSETVGAADTINENAPLQLQRIVSRCKCEFFYANYGESSIDPAMLDEVPPVPTEEPGTPWERHDKAVDAFTLMHHDLDVCTNSLQYAMVLDIVNNLLLYVEPRRREAYERLQRMRFQLQLHSVKDKGKPIQQLQNLVRCLVAKLRRLEKEMYLVQKTVTEDANSEHLISEMEHLDSQMNECKEQLNAKSEELDMMLSCYKETQLSANQKLETLRGDKPVIPVRTSEICFKHAQWRLTETDGQLGIADLVLSNFLYTKVSKSDDSVEHLLELGYIRMTNLLANEIYREVIVPTEIQSNMPVARKRAVRIFCREKAPVGGISVKEHFEINVVPFTIGLTKKFYDTMFKFCFPKRDIDYVETDESDEVEVASVSNGISGSVSTKKSKTQNCGEKSVASKKKREASFYVPIEMKDDVEKMKERAEKNKLFIYIKIPEVPVRVSYKGNKEKNLQDIRDFSLVIPTLEYHNVTWTWLDLFLAMKTDSRRVILSQAIKQKLQIKVRSGSAEEGSSPQEEDKARMLFGPRLMPSDNKPSKKSGIFKLQK